MGMPGLVRTRHIQHRGGEEVSWVKANDAWWEKGDLVAGQGQEGLNNLHILGLGREKVEFITWG